MKSLFPLSCSVLSSVKCSARHSGGSAVIRGLQSQINPWYVCTHTWHTHAAFEHVWSKRQNSYYSYDSLTGSYNVGCSVETCTGGVKVWKSQWATCVHPRHGDDDNFVSSQLHSSATLQLQTWIIKVAEWSGGRPPACCTDKTPEQMC